MMPDDALVTCCVCGRLGYVSTHICPPSWNVSTDLETVRAWLGEFYHSDNPEDAAVWHANELDGAAGTVTPRREVYVRGLESCEIIAYTVTANPEPRYTVLSGGKRDPVRK